MLFADYLTDIAASHRVKADTADTLAERRHWTREAIRFDDLADIARNDEESARAAYRPTCARQPEA